MLLRFADWLTFQVLALDPKSKFGAAVDFFIYDSIKILLLLFAMIFVIGVLRTFLPQAKLKAWMEKKSGWGYIFAALFGAVTPFCSCSSIPFFISFVKAGIPLGVCFTFLVTSPLINEYLVVLMAGFFGWKITVLYVLSGLFVGILSGFVIGTLKLEKHLVADMVSAELDSHADKQILGFRNKINFGFEEAVEIVRKIWVWVLVGVAIGSVIHNYVPQDAIQALMQRTGIFSVPIATLIGVPMYGSCAAIVPVAVVLFQKGIPLGTALAFMMAVAALSLPEAIMLRRAMKLRLILAFFGITTLAIIVIGYLFNFLQVVLIK
ncbi:MAG: permease [Candidatus Omnitrophica bacterium]|nr:permease [Candidatus Omnitrophota bacterium]